MSDAMEVDTDATVPPEEEPVSQTQETNGVPPPPPQLDPLLQRRPTNHLPTGVSPSREAADLILNYGSMFISSDETLKKVAAAVGALFDTNKDKERIYLQQYIAYCLPLSYQYSKGALCGPHANYLPTSIPLKTRKDITLAICAVWSYPGHLMPLDIQRVRYHEEVYAKTFPEVWADLRRRVRDFASPGNADEINRDLGNMPADLNRYSANDSYAHWRASLPEIECPVTREDLVGPMARIKQRSPLWDLMRRFFVGGSSIHDVVGNIFRGEPKYWPAYAEREPHYQARKVVGLAPGKKFTEFQMSNLRHGTIFEEMNQAGSTASIQHEYQVPEAKNREFKEIGMVPLYYNWQFYGLSPDGLIIDKLTQKRVGAFEFKCPYSKATKSCHDTTPDLYLEQVVQTALALEVPWCVFSSMFYRQDTGHRFSAGDKRDARNVVVTMERIKVDRDSGIGKLIRECLVVFAYYTQLVAAEHYSVNPDKSLVAARELLQSHMEIVRKRVRTFVELHETKYKSYIRWQYPRSSLPITLKEAEIKVVDYFGGNEKAAKKWIGNNIWKNGGALEMERTELHAAATQALDAGTSHPSTVHENHARQFAADATARAAEVTDVLVNNAKARASLERSGL